MNSASPEYTWSSKTGIIQRRKKTWPAENDNLWIVASDSTYIRSSNGWLNILKHLIHMIPKSCVLPTNTSEIIKTYQHLQYQPKKHCKELCRYPAQAITERWLGGPYHRNFGGVVRGPALLPCGFVDERQQRHWEMFPPKNCGFGCGFYMFTHEDTRFFERTSKSSKELVSNSMHHWSLDFLNNFCASLSSPGQCSSRRVVFGGMHRGLAMTGC